MLKIRELWKINDMLRCQSIYLSKYYSHTFLFYSMNTMLHCQFHFGSVFEVYEMLINVTIRHLPAAFSLHYHQISNWYKIWWNIIYLSSACHSHGGVLTYSIVMALAISKWYESNSITVILHGARSMIISIWIRLFIDCDFHFAAAAFPIFIISY